MRYMFVNVNNGGLQLDLRSPSKTYKNKNLNRPGKVVSINLRKGQSLDILPFFDGSLEDAHAAVKYSRDVLKLIRPDRLHIYICDDQGKEVQIEELVGKEANEKVAEAVASSPDPDATMPNMETSAMMAAHDQFEAEKSGDANPRPSEEQEVKQEVKEDKSEKNEEQKKSTKKKSSKKKKGLFGRNKKDK